MIFTVIGIASSIIFLIGDYPYFVNAAKGKIKPHRVTWGVSFLLNCIGFANQYASGAGNSLWLFAAAALATGAIFAASLFNGTGGYSKLDIFAIVTTMVGVLLWVVFDSPVLSIFSTLLVVEVALTPTILKAKKHPESETRIAWLLGSLSSFMATVSVGKLDWKLLILPFNAALIQAYIAYILYFQVKRRPVAVAAKS